MKGKLLMPNLSKRIINLRESKDWTQAELARRLNMNKSIMNRIESGERKVSADELKAIAALFEVSTDYLLGNTNIKNKQSSDSTKENKYTDADLDRMLDNAMSFDGEPITDHDREIIRAYLKGKYGK
ncbi:helix-turn-helix domain-containing protein [Enterococcus malodoratus]|nr:helix-turn-helix transcriptional regulator [Enterococcus malodoratus]